MSKSILGKKIRDYRKRADMSQLSLELEIDASPGFISRIESGKVNPTKETMVRLAKALNLSEVESTDLFGVKIDGFIQNFIDINSYYIREFISEEPNKDNFNELMNKLGINIAGIVIREANDLVLDTTILPGWARKIAESDMGKKMEMIRFSLDNHEHNLGQVNRCYNSQTIIIANGLRAIAKPLLTDRSIKIIEKTLNIKAIVTMPLTFGITKVGVLAFVTNSTKLSDIDESVFGAYASQLAYGIYASKKIYELQNENKILKNMLNT